VTDQIHILVVLMCENQRGTAQLFGLLLPKDRIGLQGIMLIRILEVAKFPDSISAIHEWP